MGDLTKNFSAWEFTCRHCGMTGIKAELVDALQLLRDYLEAPIQVTSGYRCPAHLDQIKRPGSKHGEGIAADIVTPFYDLGFVAKSAELLTRYLGRERPFKGIAINPHKGFAHLDIRDAPVVARWSYDKNGKEIAA